MKRPFMDEIKQSTVTVDTFAGLDRRQRIAEGRFTAMKNMSSEKYPLISTRRRRGLKESLEECAGLISKEHLCYVSGTGIHVGTEFVDMGLTSVPKQLISYGSYIIIMPDKKYINYADHEDRGNIEAVFETSNTVTIKPCKADGTEYTISTYGDTPPENPANGDYWGDTSGKKIVLKQYSSYSLSWVSVASSYISITSGSAAEGNGIGKNFSVGDAVTITVPENEIKKNKYLKELNTTAVISAMGVESISIVIPNVTIPGMDSEGNFVGASYNFRGITVERRMPVMDFVIESGNRLWGCRYGLNSSGERVNEIYASKLGDFKNWNVFQGVSTDSYCASVGSDGKFTGAISYRGIPHFFKERILHKVMGTIPSSFQVMSAEMDGVREMCQSSLAVIDNILYYKSRTSVCAYDGSFPTEIGSALGRNTYTDAAAGSVNGMYYLSMRGKDGFETFCFDTSCSVWSKEDNTAIIQFCEHRGVLYYTDGKSIYTVNGECTEDDFEWYAETGDIGISTDQRKYISRLVIRMKLALGARMTVSVCYDSSDTWEILYNAQGGSMKTYNVNVRPKRCDHLKLRIDGIGDCEIYSITKHLQYGSIF